MIEVNGPLYESEGALKYYVGPNGGYKLIVEVDQDIVDYYRKLIPKWVASLNPQKYPAHVSVVRNEIPANLEFWGKYEGQSLTFEYSPTIHNGTVYYWLNVFSKRLEEIRIELGLPVSTEYTRPPGPYIKCFHCTLGNVKQVP